ncbi:unnamed protein product [Alternaria alternata]
MASDAANLTESGITIPSDSENYDANNELSSSSPASSTINLFLPFVNGLMLGFGELVANEAAYRLGWSGTKVFPSHRSGSDSRRVGPGVEMRADPVERRRRNGQELDMYTSLE